MTLNVKALRRGGRAVDCSGLENRQTRKGLVSSNLTLSDFFFLYCRELPSHVQPRLQPERARRCR